jgi:hypothetical protein
MKLSDAERTERWEKYLIEHGPNPATSFYGSMAWEACMSAAFRDLLYKEGYEDPTYEADKAEEAAYAKEFSDEGLTHAEGDEEAV